MSGWFDDENSKCYSSINITELLELKDSDNLSSSRLFLSSSNNIYISEPNDYINAENESNVFLNQNGGCLLKVKRSNNNQAKQNQANTLKQLFRIFKGKQRKYSPHEASK